jgi:sugar-specific transcriptional regulator TrmB
MLKQFLENIGLNDKEAAVYLALLEYEYASVKEIADKTAIKRPTVYTVLASLAKKGLVSETSVGKKTRYQAEPAERLETFVERQKIALDEQSKRLKDMIPQLKSVERHLGEKPVIQYFEGKEGAASMNELLYENDEEGGGTAYLLFSADLLGNLFPENERAKFKKFRVEKKVKLKAILNDSKNPAVSDATVDSIAVEEKDHPFTCDIAVYKDRVRICVLNKKMPGVFIRSKEVADTLRNLFLIAFEGLKNNSGR